MTEQCQPIQRQSPLQLRTTDWTASSFHEMQHRNPDDISPLSKGECDSHEELYSGEGGTPSTSTGNERDGSTSGTPVPPANHVTGLTNVQVDWRDELRRIIREEVEEGFQKIYAASETPGSSAAATPPISQKPGVRFSDRPPFFKRPAGVSRATSSYEPPAEWGMLFDGDGYATHRLGRVLRGLGQHIIDEYVPKKSIVITPEKLGMFYSNFRIESERYPFFEIFTSKSKNSNEYLADLYDDLECQHHLVQKEPRSRPRVPGLTPVGFAQYLTTCILAYPDEEFRRLEKIVAEIPLLADAATSDGPQERLPRTIIRDCLPAKYDVKKRKLLNGALDDLMYDLKLQPSGSRPPITRPTNLENRGSNTSHPSRRRYAPVALHTIGDESVPEEYNPKSESRRFPSGSLPANGDKGAKEGHGNSYGWEAHREHDRGLGLVTLREGGAKLNPRVSGYVKPTEASISSNISSRSQPISSSFSRSSTPSVVLPPPPVGISASASISPNSSFSGRPRSPQLKGYSASVPDFIASDTWVPAANAGSSEDPSLEIGTVANTVQRRDPNAGYHTASIVGNGRTTALTQPPQELQRAVAREGVNGGVRTPPGPGPDRRLERQPSRQRRSLVSFTTEEAPVAEDDSGLTWGEYLKSRKTGKRGSGGSAPGWF